MDKVAIYKEHIQKIAMARAWKKNFTEGIRKTLEDSNILDHAKELKGLNKGTANITNKYGGKVVNASNAKAVGDAAEKGTQFARFEYTRSMLAPRQEVKDALHDTIVRNGGFVSLPGANSREGGLVMSGRVSNFKGDHLPKEVNDKIPGMNDKLDHAYSNAIMRRHEADELRYGLQSARNKNKRMEIEGDTHPTTGVFSHISPKVLGRESANTAIAPSKTKDFLHMFRDGSGETDYLKYHGLDYGKSGVYNKSVNSKMENAQNLGNRNAMKP